MRVLVTDDPSKPHANAGQVLDLPEAEAQGMIARGTATLAPDEPPAESPALHEPAPASTPHIDTDDDAEVDPEDKIPGRVRHVQSKPTSRGKRR